MHQSSFIVESSRVIWRNQGFAFPVLSTYISRVIALLQIKLVGDRERIEHVSELFRFRIVRLILCSRAEEDMELPGRLIVGENFDGAVLLDIVGIAPQTPPSAR